MDITFVSFDEVPSFKGATTHILSGLRIPSQKHRVRLISLGSLALRPSTGILHYPINITERNTLKRGFLFRERVQSVLRQHKADLVHFRTPWEGLPIVRRGISCIFEVNGLPSVELPYHFSALSTTALDTFRSWEEECLAGASHIICPSAQIEQFIREHYRVCRGKLISVFRNAYDPLPLPFAARTTCSKRAVYIGTLSSWQGIVWALGAFRELQGSWTLDVFSPYSKLLWKRFQHRVRRLGLGESVHLYEPIHRAALLEKLPCYDAGLAPLVRTERNNLQGCYPLKLLEYLAHGLPVIASDLPVNRQVIIHEVNGLIHEANSILSLVACLERIKNEPDLLASLRAGSIPSLKTQWTWQEYGQRLCELYERFA